jgi:hypothetical protein
MDRVSYNPPPVGSQEWLDALDWPEQHREEVKRNRLKSLEPKSKFAFPEPTKAMTRKGPRGGRYRMVVSKDGTLYRQYF